MKLSAHITGNQSGFTLLEVLIAMSIFSVVGITTFALLKNTLSTRRITEQHISAKSAKQQFLNTLNHDFANAVLFAGIGFNGSADKVDFASRMDNDTTGQNLVHVLYKLDTDSNANTDQLVRLLSNFRKDVRRETIYSGIANLKFEYLQRQKKKMIWLPCFNKSDELPAAVRLQINNDAGTGEEYYFPVMQ